MVVRNPQTKNVLKNPELFIRRLQRQIIRWQNAVAVTKHCADANRGETIIRWSLHTETIAVSNTTRLMQFNVGDIVAQIGKVTSVKASKCSGGNKKSSLTFTPLETRKMPKDFCSQRNGFEE